MFLVERCQRIDIFIMLFQKRSMFPKDDVWDRPPPPHPSTTTSSPNTSQNSSLASYFHLKNLGKLFGATLRRNVFWNCTLLAKSILIQLSNLMLVYCIQKKRISLAQNPQKNYYKTLYRLKLFTVPQFPTQQNIESVWKWPVFCWDGFPGVTTHDDSILLSCCKAEIICFSFGMFQ